jgi:hypothetical protein
MTGIGGCVAPTQIGKPYKPCPLHLLLNIAVSCTFSERGKSDEMSLLRLLINDR